MFLKFILCRIIVDQDMLRCGQRDVYIKPECVCSFFHVYEATWYHGHSFCPHGAASDIVTQLKCRHQVVTFLSHMKIPHLVVISSSILYKHNSHCNFCSSMKKYMYHNMYLLHKYFCH